MTCVKTARQPFLTRGEEGRVLLADSSSFTAAWTTSSREYLGWRAGPHQAYVSENLTTGNITEHSCVAAMV